ncbi:hypothetical protein [Deinococcus cellulosilyticus]|uniref:Uncharacterized protein n=1 Tax=Deinococcus cellulosilyticus (strain DSM 18568 / NBRC 106333 / KACC 11606 / 5516J-15) TaxID=1223518 RepID=A0A511N1U2_DEIC1|nr:hypothetical protein [Deinococcus cellulosilyticus]GEM46336.1 hypothetical protein DC3_19710 [Deinococcus cellulosilyticus NBRC 106333 = KACC 11606]
MNQTYHFRVQLHQTETSSPVLLEWLQTLTGMIITIDSFKPRSIWQPLRTGTCDLSIHSSRDEAIVFYNLVQQHHPIDALQTL